MRLQVATRAPLLPKAQSPPGPGHSCHTVVSDPQGLTGQEMVPGPQARLRWASPEKGDIQHCSVGSLLLISSFPSVAVSSKGREC